MARLNTQQQTDISHNKRAPDMYRCLSKMRSCLYCIYSSFSPAMNENGTGGALRVQCYSVFTQSQCVRVCVCGAFSRIHRNDNSINEKKREKCSKTKSTRTLFFITHFYVIFIFKFGQNRKKRRQNCSIGDSLAFTTRARQKVWISNSNVALTKTKNEMTEKKNKIFVLYNCRTAICDEYKNMLNLNVRARDGFWCGRTEEVEMVFE